MDTKYVISVDTLDLTLLPLAYQPRRNITPFWNRNDDLSEFTIHIKDTPTELPPTEVSTPPTQAIETTVCHMCKVDVPKKFFKEHRNSPKHNIYTKIANIALQRIKEHINDGCDCDETEADTFNYFCTHCVAIVNINERRSHEKSHSHKNSVFLDKCLSDFLNLYTNSDETGDEDVNIVSVTSTKKNVNEDNKFDLKNYIDILKDKYKMSMKFKVINEDRLEVDIDGSIVEVATQNFLGFKTKTGDSLECVVCNEVVKIRDKVEHTMSAKHMFRVSIPFKDVHCKREIYPLWHHCVLCNDIIKNYAIHTISDPNHSRLLQEALKYKVNDKSKDNSISSENWTLVTNKTDKTDPSTNQDSSLNKYSDLLDNDKNSMTSKDDSSPNKTFCSHCNVFIVTKNLKKHLSTTKHLCNAISPFYYLFQLDLDIKTCRICDVIVDVDDFVKHVNLSEHTNRYNTLLATNKIRKIDKNQLFCDVCDKFVFVRNELYHMKGHDHMQNLISNTNSSPSNSDYHCDVCDVYVTNTVKDIQTHNEGMPHNLNKLTKPTANVSSLMGNYFYNYTMLETESPGMVNCSVCDMLVPKDEEIIQKHIENENHIGLYGKLLQDHKLVPRNEDILCNICNVFVGFKSEIMHLRGKRHLKNLRKTEEKPTIYLAEEDNDTLEARVKVKASGVTLDKAELKVIHEHFDISDTLKELICKTCKVSVPFTVYNSNGHLGGSKHKQKLMDIAIMNSATNL